MKVGSITVLINNGRTFLVKRSDFPVWEVQGGAIEKGETPKEAGVREALEETGFKIDIVKKISEYIDVRTKNVTTHVYEGKVVSGKYRREYKGCEGKWFDLGNIPLSITAKTKSIIEDYQKNKNELIIKPDIPLFSVNNIHLVFLHPLSFIKYLLKTLRTKNYII